MGLLSSLGLGRTHRHQHILSTALFPTAEYTASVSAWADSVQALADSQTCECRLGQIVHYRAKAVATPGSGPPREFVLVSIRHQSAGKRAVVLADGDDDDNKELSFPYTRGTGTGAIGVSTGASRGRGRVWVSSDATAASLLRRHVPAGVNWDEIQTVKFPKASNAPSIAHLAALLALLDRHASLLLPGDAQVRRGWFAYCIGEVMKEIFGGQVKTNKKMERVVSRGTKVNGGQDTVDVLVREFRAAWEDFSRGQGGLSTEIMSKRQDEPRVNGRSRTKKTQMESLVDMLRTMNP